MSHTIGRHRPSTSPRGDVTVLCDYCGVPWPRSKCRLDGANRWACPDDRKGLDVVSTAQADAEGLRRASLARQAGENGNVPEEDVYT